MYAEELEWSVVESVVDLLHSELQMMLGVQVNQMPPPSWSDRVDPKLKEMEIKVEDAHDRRSASTFTSRPLSLDTMMGDFLLLVRKITFNSTVGIYLFYVNRDQPKQ